MIVLNGVKSRLDITFQPGDILEIRGLPIAQVTFEMSFGNDSMEEFVNTFSYYADMADGELLTLKDSRGMVYEMVDSFVDSAKGQLVMLYKGVE